MISKHPIACSSIRAVLGSSLPLTRLGWARRSRRITVVLFMGLWLSAYARPVLAEGCHAPEKPVLGMTFSWEVIETPASLPDAVDLRLPSFSKAPCSSETPLPSQSKHSLPSSALTFALEVLPLASLSRCQATPSTETLEARDSTFRLDRPPRSRRALV